MARITNELREWFESGYVHEYHGDDDGDFKKVTTPWFGWKTVIEGMLDRIDEAHKHAIGYVDDRDPETMAENGWVKLPVDADGVLIRLGDEMEERSGHMFEVASLMAFGGGDNWLVLSDPRNFSSFREPHDIRHYHVPTVEDVLREIVHKCQPTYSKDGSYTTGLTKEEFAEYAAKLRAIIEGSKGPEWQETDSQDEGR